MCFYLTPKPHIAIYLSQTFNCLKLLSFEPSLKAMRDLRDWKCSCNARMVHSLSILSFYCHFRLNTTCVRIFLSFILTGQWSFKDFRCGKNFSVFCCHHHHAMQHEQPRFQFDISHITMSKIFSRFFHENDIEEEEAKI